jgi:ABC-type sugar transport system permease subunit
MRRSSLTGLLLLVPALLFFAGYVLYPIVDTCLLSGTSWSVVGGAKLAVGARNYTDLCHDPGFLTALRNNGLFIVLSLAVQLPLALLLAVGLGSQLRRHQFLRTLFFAPFVMPVVAVGLLWRLIYEPNLGALNTLLNALHLSAWARGWLGEGELAIFAVIAVSCWRYVGFHMMILLAGLQAIPGDLLEAAQLDGATPWQTFMAVTLPLLRRVLLVDALLITVGSIKIFDLVKVMTDGGPGTASEVLATYMFRLAFVEDRMGASAAVAVVMLALTLLLTIGYVRLTNSEDDALPDWPGRWALRMLGVGLVVWLGWRGRGLIHTPGVLLAVVGGIVVVGLAVAGLVRLARSASQGTTRVLADAGFAVLAILFLIPVIWGVLGSFKSLNELLLSPWSWPHPWVWGNYAQAWTGGIGRYLFNSAVVTVLSVGLALLCAAPAAFGLARLNLPGKALLFALIVSGLLLPVHASLIPLYIQCNRLGIANWPALLGPYVAFGLPLMVLMLRAYFAGIPNELQEAATLDGAGPWRTLWQVFLPVARPAVATVCIFQAAWVWNELPLAMVLVRDKAWQILPVGLLNFQGEHSADWAALLAGVTLAMVPVLALYFLFQKHIIKGLTAGAVK